MDFPWYVWAGLIVVMFALVVRDLYRKHHISVLPHASPRQLCWSVLASVLKSPFLLVDLMLWLLLTPFRRCFWQWMGGGFPLVRTHISVDGRLTAWTIAVAAGIALVWWGPKWYVQLLPDVVPVTNEQGIDIDTAVDKLAKEEGFRLAIIQIAGGMLLLLGLNRGWLELRLSREGQITDRFTRAVDQLGHASVDVRLGGVYALERIAHDYREYHWMVMEVLAAYVRENAPWPPDSWRLTREDAARAGITFEHQDRDLPVLDEQNKETLKPREDVQTALTVIGRRNAKHDKPLPGRAAEPRLVDLRRSCLIGAEMPDAHLREALLQGAHLEHAYLVGARMERAYLAGADLSSASMVRAQLGYADLSFAYLAKANLKRAHVEGVVLYAAQLDGANLDVAGRQLISDRHGLRMEYSYRLSWLDIGTASISGTILPIYLVDTPEGYARAVAGGADVSSVPIPEGYEEYVAAWDEGEAVDPDTTDAAGD